jgi:hypothetical protein
MAAVSLSGWGQAQKHFALTAHQVAQALSDSGLRIADQQVLLLANVVAAEPDPALELLSVVPLGEGGAGQRSDSRYRVRMACQQPGKCLPFYAIVSWPQGTAARASGVSAFSASGALQPKPVVTMRAGTHATMVIDDKRSHIQIAVISMEGGMAGHRIRVASPDHKQVYVAEVVSANLLKGSF